MDPSSSSPQHDASLALIPAPSLPPPPPPSTSSRRLPPPCWSHEETVALIDSYRDKWYALRRSNLKATHWQEVADAVSNRCPLASPPKTAVQCRHKMEKLRKRYRTEIQRAKSMPISRFTSSWVHFKRMDSMEKGPQAANEIADSGSEDNEDEEDDVDVDDYDRITYQDVVKNGSGNSRSIYGSASNGGIGGGSGGSGFRIRIPSGVSVAKPGIGFRQKNYGKFDQSPNPSPSPSPNLGTRVLVDGFWGKSKLGKRSSSDVDGGMREREREREGNGVAEMVAAIKVLGDGFVKMEQMKMEMAREIETMRMEMEMKRTEMILESQERIVEAFAKAVLEKKKKTKRLASPES